MTKRLFALALLVPLALAPAARPAAKDAGAGQQLENVQVIDRTMRVADARRFMVQFNQALGVQCRDCHDLKNFASDEKPLKLVARDMMKMQVQINEKWFPGQGEVVTCWSCHHGQRKPSQALPLGGAEADSLLDAVDADAAKPGTTK